jgi:hypothetical protein
MLREKLELNFLYNIQKFVSKIILFELNSKIFILKKKILKNKKKKKK